MSVDTVIAGGTLVTADRTFEGALAIDDGTIVGVGAAEQLPDADDVVDATGKYVMPGVVDPHVHVADPFSIDSYETASKAAALGGTTTVIGFAFQGWNPATEAFDGSYSLPEAIDSVRERGADSLVDFGVHGAVTEETDEGLEDLAEVVPNGVPSIKMFTAYDVGLSNGFMHRVFERLAALDGVGVLHTEDGSVCDVLTEACKREGKGDPVHYPASRPDYAEAMAADDAVRMALETGAKYYGIHTSCRKAAEVLEAAREDGSRVRAETCVHFTTLDESVYAEQGTLPLFAPPMRTPDDVEAMFEHLQAGSLDVVSTDHCAYTEASKQVDDWWDSPFGANLLQTGFPVFHDEAVTQRGFGYPTLVRLVSTAPAQTFGLPEKGTLTPGTDADVVVFDPDASYTIDAADNESKADFSIFEGREVTGRVEKTFVRGTLVADDGEIVADPGHGQFVERIQPDWSA
ncbi:dihydroorotase family protein [Halorientalis brevis]|uniref:Dihydroorotase family protein n=1 Tax=Halorientalis brevis TaxID=1126241 RepID=A0ABD6CEA0_9EURY|nr:amidohydrolase family protein [Halorientalis brevis]